MSPQGIKTLPWPLCFVPLVAVLCLLTGCVYIPTLGHDLKGHRAINSERTLARFEPLKTTRADVLLALGMPSWSLEGDRFFVYRGTQIEGYLAIGIAPGAGAVAENRRTRFVAVEFTPDNRVRRVARIDDMGAADAQKALDDWIAGKATTSPDALDAVRDEEGG